MSNYWVVGAMFGGSEDQLPKFIERGYWYCWDPEKVRKREIPVKAQRLFPMIKPGDRIAVKKLQGQGASKMSVRALGEVTAVDHDEWRIYVRWLVTNINREVPVAGCMSAIQGPFKESEWRSSIFSI
ncbi:hypothetical protein [Pseudomonas sp. EZ-C24]|uniref:hypothetical protein n=1 Tax=Pseudomonas sp. EZ-C24 TaxID=2753617 RepID=UPI00165E8515|nr:hypothetical protein [Pseudomonas sp. EZ-C24]